MSKKLQGQVAVVTGASKGIGATIAEQLAMAGAAVVVNYATSRAGAEAVVNRIQQSEGKAVAVQADVSKPEDIRRMFAETKKADVECLMAAKIVLAALNHLWSTLEATRCPRTAGCAFAHCREKRRKSERGIQ